ncbi:MAG: carotenoid biosynthesis protein, partial [Blastocatellia bacterium]
MSTTIEDTHVSKRLESQTSSYGRTSIALWAMLGLYVAARFLQLIPDRVSILVILAMHIVPVTIFALVHGANRYRWRGVLTFVALSLVVENIFENLSVRTGFPYGHYYFTNLMGPKLAQVPLSLGLAYVGMGYLSWTLARLILGDAGRRLTGSRLVTVPLIAAFI